jgi:hypothetical protein
MKQTGRLLDIRRGQTPVFAFNELVACRFNVDSD